MLKERKIDEDAESYVQTTKQKRWWWWTTTTI